MLQFQFLLKHHPWRFLLYLEWTLLGIVALSEAMLPVASMPRNTPLSWLCWAGLTAMGLRLPQQYRMKILYTSLEFGLILISAIWGSIHLFPLLYIVLVIRNSIVFSGKIRLIVLGLAFVSFLITLNYRFTSLTRFSPWIVPRDLSTVLLSLVLLMGIVLVFSQLLVERALSERQNREQLATANTQLEIANTQLRQYAIRIEDLATVQERNRIARDIHDALGHSLTVFNLHLSAALQLLDHDPAEARDLLVEAKQVGETALRDVRQSVSALRSDPLQGQSLTVAIATLVKELQRSTGISADYTLDGEERIPQDIKVALYRIVQETLTNICKYAEATTVRIEITTADNLLQVLVEDNGKGFNLKQTTTGFGLQGMRERVLALGGTLEIRTAPGAGCQVTVLCPLP